MSVSAGTKSSNFLLIVSLVVVFAGFASLVGSSVFLRPLADDYAFGASATEGLWTAIYAWWSSHSGDLFLIVMWVLLVGMPLAWLPMGLTSSVSFLLAGVLVGGLGVLALGLAKRPFTWRAGAVWVTITLAWWIHLWSAELIFRDFDNRGVALYLTHWPTVNVAYVIVPALHIGIFLLLLRGKFSSGRFSPLIALFLGLVLGTSGYVLAAGLGAFSLLLAIGQWVLAGFRSSVSFFSYFLGALVGFVWSLTSQGASARRQSLLDIEMQTFIFDAIRTAPEGIGDWLGAVVSFETLLALGIGGLTAWFAGQHGTATVDRWRVVQTIAYLVPLSLLFAVVNAVSELAAYEASWHLTSTKLLVFLWSIGLGHVLYRPVRDFLESRANFDLPVWIGKIAALVLVLGLLGAGTVGAASSIVDRHIEWESGEAPVRWAQDREADWIKPGWEKIVEFRIRQGLG